MRELLHNKIACIALINIVNNSEAYDQLPLQVPWTSILIFVFASFAELLFSMDLPQQQQRQSLAFAINFIVYIVCNSMHCKIFAFVIYSE